MSLVDVKHAGLFRVDFLRVVLDIDYKAISEYSLEHSKTWDRYTTYHDRALNDRWKEGLPERDKFEADIYEAGHEFIKRTKRRPFEETPFLYYWCSIYRKGDHHGSHNHPNSLIAGTYYPQVAEDSSNITLEAPWKSHIMHDTLNFKESLFMYKPNAGDMILWPSWIDHRVNPQIETDKPRIAISFNLDYAKYHHD